MAPRACLGLAPLMALVLLFSTGATAVDRTLPVTVALHGVPPADLEGRLLVQGVSTETSIELDSATVTFETPVDADSVVLTLDASCCWAAPLEVELTERPHEQIDLPVYPAARLTATLVGLRHEPEPGDARITISSPPTLGGTEQISLGATTQDCERTGFQISCRVPATAVDLRLQVDEFAPSYRLDVLPQPGETLDAGAIPMVPGGSVTGRVEGIPGVDAPIEIHARRQLAGWLSDPRERRRMTTGSVDVRPDDRGLFQLTGLETGRYRIVIEQEGAAELVVDDVDVASGRETLLDDLELQPPARLEVLLDPAIGPDELPWHLELLRTAEAAQRRDLVASDVADETGSWASPELRTGEYHLSVKSGDGSRWLSEAVLVDSTSQLLALRIPLVEVEGRVVRGDDPQPASLIFGTRHGARQVSVTSDKEGEFTMYLPFEGSWPVELVSLGVTDDDQSRDRLSELMVALEPIDVTVRSGQSKARIEVRVPATRIAGRVVDEKGQAVDGAFVLGRRSGERSGKVFEVVTDDAGHFAVEAIAEGEVGLQARSRDHQSRWTSLVVSEDLETPELELVLERSRILDGQVTAAGRPLAGARVIALPAGPAIPESRQTTTRLDGGFELELPPATRAVSLLVAPPGFALRLVGHPVDARNAPAILDVPLRGGNLVLEAADSETLSHSWLIHEGAAIRVGFLRPILFPSGHLDMGSGWISVHGFAPGEYHLCSPAGTTQCTSGFLAPGDSIRLGVPKQEHPSGHRAPIDPTTEPVSDSGVMP
ncbi:MAG: carboxypeptidase-like regulatory domain-containing protein [Acidobacteriota bacterium]